MEGGEKINWAEEADLAKVVKILAGTTVVPLQVAADIAGDVVESLGSSVPKPSTLVSHLIDMRISALQTVTKLIEKELSLLETYKKDLETKEAQKEKVTVE